MDSRRLGVLVAKVNKFSLTFQGENTAADTGEKEEGKEQRELIQLLALHVQKGNVALFINRIPDDEDAGIIL